MKMRHVFDFETMAHLRFAHLAFDFRPGHEGRDRVDHDDVDAAGADEDLDDFERLLAVVGLRDEEVVEIDAELARVARVERVLGVDERRHAADLLRFRDHLQRQRRLARGLRSEDLDHTAARHAADAQRVVQAHRPGRDRGHLRDDILLPKAHDGALAKLLLDLADGQVDGFRALAVVTVVVACQCCHIAPRKKSERR